MGLPQINIVFRSLATSAITRSARGIATLIIKDETATEKTYNFKKFVDVTKDTFSTKNYDLIKLAFLGNPSKLIVEVINETNKRTINTVLKDLEVKKLNYLAYPQAEEVDNTLIQTWIVSCRKEGKKFKAVLANIDSDEEGVINFTTTGMQSGTESYTTAEYCARLAGIFAGLPLTRSATYFVLNELDSIVEHDDPNADIDNGQLILTNDGEKIKIARGVNSLTNTPAPKSDDFKKIKLVEAMDIMYEDVKKTFEDEYIGQVLNSYDNKVIFLTSINAYFKQLSKEGVLDPNYNNLAEIDVEANELYLQSKGINTDTMTEQQIKEANTGSFVFFKANVKLLDAMEDFDFNIYI